MRARQLDMNISDLMDLADKAGSMRDLLRNMIIMAYEEPKFYTEEAKERAINEFSNHVQAACYSNKK